jgi:hypothetical protein
MGICDRYSWDPLLEYSRHRFCYFFSGESLPECAITTEPPVADAGYVLLFAKGQWTQIEDKTGQLYYENNGTKHVVPDAWFTLPDGCTFVAPPEDKTTFVARWNGTEWVYVKDLRGQVIWSTTTREP